MKTTTKITFIIVLFIAITFILLFISGMISGTMDNGWLMVK
ncbi:MAG TPA: hypothetical protein VJ455_03375 [Ignavibacteria bacterium]|nr:hypothetical protein [Ignavibacteria bacterium]